MNDIESFYGRRRNSPNVRNRCVAKTTVCENARSGRRKPDIVGYARVSTKGQRHRLQIDALKAAGCTRIVKEVGSGASWDRPHFNDILRSLRAGDTVIVWRVDRWARDLLLLLQTTRDMEQKGIVFRSLTENFDPSTALGKLNLHIVGSFAEYEFRGNLERTEAGLVAAKKCGHRGGRPPSLTTDQVALAKAMLADTSAKVPDVARRLGVAPATLYRYLGGVGV